ncbi:putative nucleotidyltransferase [Dioscorea sansibarensis]
MFVYDDTSGFGLAYNSSVQLCIGPGSTCCLAKAPDGNEGLYSALKSSKLLEDMAMRGVEYVDCYGVDNVPVKISISESSYRILPFFLHATLIS